MFSQHRGHLIDVADHFVSFTTEGSPATRVEPLDLAIVRKQRRFSSTTLDDLFLIWIAAARQYLEEATGTQLIDGTWERWLDTFPWHRSIELPHPPLQSIVNIKYDDADGNEQTLDSMAYRIVAPAGPYAQRGRLVLNDGFSWPSPANHPKAVRIQYVAGYGETPADIPPLVSYALMMLVGHFHKFAEEISEARANILQLPIGANSVIKAMKYAALPTLPPARSQIGITDGSGQWR